MTPLFLLRPEIPETWFREAESNNKDTKINRSTHKCLSRGCKCPLTRYTEIEQVNEVVWFSQNESICLPPFLHETIRWTGTFFVARHSLPLLLALRNAYNYARPSQKLPAHSSSRNSSRFKIRFSFMIPPDVLFTIDITVKHMGDLTYTRLITLANTLYSSAKKYSLRHRNLMVYTIIK